jgi:hypothetical protein
MPSLKEAKHETVGIMTSEARAVNGASNIPGESLALGIDRDAANVEGDMTSEEKHTRVSAIVPAIAEDKTGTPPQGVSVRGGETELKNVKHDLRRDGHASRARSLSVAFLSFECAPASPSKTKVMPKSGARQATIFMSLIDSGHVRIEGTLRDEAFLAEVSDVEQDGAGRRGQRATRALAI